MSSTARPASSTSALPSAIIAVTCLTIRRDLSHRTLTWRQLELRGVILFAMVFAALVSHHVYHLEPIKLISFTFLALVTATASVSIRIVVGATVLCNRDDALVRRPGEP